jgi:hypothetical protein
VDGHRWVSWVEDLGTIAAGRGRGSRVVDRELWVADVGPRLSSGGASVELALIAAVVVGRVGRCDPWLAAVPMVVFVEVHAARFPGGLRGRLVFVAFEVKRTAVSGSRTSWNHGRGSS